MPRPAACGCPPSHAPFVPGSGRSPQTFLTPEVGKCPRGTPEALPHRENQVVSCTLEHTTTCRRSPVPRGQPLVQWCRPLFVVEGDPSYHTARRSSYDKPTREVACSGCRRWLVLAPPGADSLLVSYHVSIVVVRQRHHLCPLLAVPEGALRSGRPGLSRAGLVSGMHASMHIGRPAVFLASLVVVGVVRFRAGR